MRYEVINKIGDVVAAFRIKKDAEAYAEMKGYMMREVDDYTSYEKCYFGGYEEVEIDGTSYYQKGRM